MPETLADKGYYDSPISSERSVRLFGLLKNTGISAAVLLKAFKETSEGTAQWLGFFARQHRNPNPDDWLFLLIRKAPETTTLVAPKDFGNRLPAGEEQPMLAEVLAKAMADKKAGDAVVLIGGNQKLKKALEVACKPFKAKVSKNDGPAKDEIFGWLETIIRYDLTVTPPPDRARAMAILQFTLL